MLARAGVLRCALTGATTRTREEAGASLLTEVEQAKAVTKRRKYKIRKGEGAGGVTRTTRKEHGLVMHQKRMELIEAGKAIPEELKPLRQRNDERRVKRLEDAQPGAVQSLTNLLAKRPEMRQFTARNEFCTQVNNSRTDVHPLLQGRWWDVLKAAPQGLLRHHVRELAPILEARMNPSSFHHFYESSDIEVLKQKGMVFEGRDGEPLKLTHEELRQTREADLYKRTDPKLRAFLRFQYNRRSETARRGKTRAFRDTPYYAPLAYNDGDALAYVGYRLHPIYAVMLRVYGEVILRAPKFAPRSMLDFGAGFGTSIFTALEVWKGIGVGKHTDKGTPREQLHVLRYLNHNQRERFAHPRLADADLRGLLGDILEKEAAALDQKATAVRAQVAKGLLPSGSDVEAVDAARERRALLTDEVWESTAKWKGDAAEIEAELGLDEDFLGEGMYAGGETKAFEQTDYFLEKDHSAYPKPQEAADLEARGIDPARYLRWYRQRGDWADAYYKHVEKAKMERDPSYRPLSALQYLEARGKEEQPDKSLPSALLHADDADAHENKAAVYKNWEKRVPEILSTIIAIEPSRAMTNYGLDFLGDVAPHVRWKKFLTEGPSSVASPAENAAEQHQQDLVVASYTLSELASEELRADAARALWEKCSGILIIVEAGTGAGFKLVLDARRTILEEYGSVGPWEFQPTVLAPCPHDMRCPVQYAVQGRRFPGLRTCHSRASYGQSFVEQWVTENNAAVRDEEYSYVILARNEVIPEKAQRRVADYKPTIIGDNPKTMDSDPRIKALRRRLSKEGSRVAGDNRIPVKPKGRRDLYPADEDIPYPKTELNLNPFAGRWRNYDRLRTAKDYLAVHKERAEYLEKFRARSWVYNRVVRPVAEGKSGMHQVVDICTPHGTQERVVIPRRRRKDGAGDLVHMAQPGALLPNLPYMQRYEWVQGDTPNTFAPPSKSLSPLEAEEMARGMEQLDAENQRDADNEEDDPEVAALRAATQARLERAKRGDADAAAEIRAELKSMAFNPRA